MTDYSKMSDEEVSARVGDLLGVKWANIDNNYHPLSVWGDGGLRVFNPCNSWADAGPIIEKHGIGLTRSGSLWRASCLINGYFYHERPLRAAMIVFLMMKESQND